LQDGSPTWWRRNAARRLALAGLLAVLLGRIALTYPVFNDTFDEAGHLRAGLEILERGRFTIQAEQPPLGLTMLAVLPYYLGGLRLGAVDDLWGTGAWATHETTFYWRTLALARAGNLVFASLIFLFVYLWSARVAGPGAGVAAAAVVACCPTILGHASLATLDAGGAAGVLAASYFFWRWSEEPSWRYCLASAVAFAGAVLCKLSALVFLPLIAVVYCFAAWRRGISRVVVFIGVAALLIWAGYGFETGVLVPPGHGYTSPFSRGSASSLPNFLVRTLGPIRVPGHRFLQGIIEVLSHNESGQRAYLLGHFSTRGWWYFFPVAVAVKSTLPLLLLAAMGAIVRPRQAWASLVAIAVVMGAGMASHLNLGVRYVLVVFPFLAILGASAFASGRRAVTAVAAVLLGWHAVESVAAHPDYLAYFNEVACGREERFLLDSNLDWGQDLARLGRYQRDKQIADLRVSYFGRTSLEKAGVHASPLPPGQPVHGWVAVSVNNLLGLYNDPADFAWLGERRPEARIGKSIWLYYVP
jgi:4-amino-4-deoxy-L-arabinose transferase-like glycosyltransferase